MVEGAAVLGEEFVEGLEGVCVQLDGGVLPEEGAGGVVEVGPAEGEELGDEETVPGEEEQGSVEVGVGLGVKEESGEFVVCWGLGGDGEAGWSFEIAEGVLED